MDADEIKAAVNLALPLRPPTFEEQLPPARKIAELEEYLMSSAFAQAELEEALHWIELLVQHFKDKIEDMRGYEACLPPKQRERLTKDDILRAKRMADPITFELGTEMRQLRATALRQIDRLRFEAQFVISRAYTFIAGS